jgi:hypothetical protein
MLITSVRLGEKFGMLPSEVMEKATTFDYMAVDVNEAYENFHQEGQTKKNYDQTYLEEMMKKVKGNDKL